MVSSMIGPQYHDGQFWKFSAIAADGSPNNFDTPVVPEFSADFEVSTKKIRLLYCYKDKIVHSFVQSIIIFDVQFAHFHGTEDGTIQYEGQNPGPAFLNNAEVISAQL